MIKVQEWDEPLPLGPIDPPAVRPARTLAQQEVDQRPKWARYTATDRPARCDDCMALHVEGPAPLARTARWVRRITRHSARYLCSEHAQMWRRRDGLKRLEEERW